MNAFDDLARRARNLVASEDLLDAATGCKVSRKVTGAGVTYVVTSSTTGYTLRVGQPADVPRAARYVVAFQPSHVAAIEAECSSLRSALNAITAALEHGDVPQLLDAVDSIAADARTLVAATQPVADAITEASER